jgi:hypothetical protein
MVLIYPVPARGAATPEREDMTGILAHDKTAITDQARDDISGLAEPRA